MGIIRGGGRNRSPRDHIRERGFEGRAAPRDIWGSAASPQAATIPEPQGHKGTRKFVVAFPWSLVVQRFHIQGRGLEMLRQ
jgi:hypothetical protein